MNSAARRLASEPLLLVGAALVALASGAGAANRLAPARWSELCLIAVMMISAVTLACMCDEKIWRWISPIAILAAVLCFLLQHVLDVRGELLATLTWGAIVVGVASISKLDAQLALAGLLGSAVVGLVLVAMVRWVGGDRPFWSVQVLAAAAAVAAFALASICLRTIWKSRSLVLVPEAVMLLVGSLFCMLASLDVDSRWTVSSLMVVAAAILIERHVPQFELVSLDLPGRLPNRVFGLSAATLVLGAAASIGVAATDGLFAASLIGVFLMGMLSSGWLAHWGLIEQSSEVESLRAAARESRVDPLTELLNRRGLIERLDEEISRANRFGHPLSVIMLDIDDFKRVNDEYGHGAGDVLLQMAARSIEQSIRSIDIAGRLGGDEFVVLLPETSLDGASVVANRIRQRVTSERMPTIFTCSLGLAQLGPSRDERSSLLDAADAALYAAKASGKNRVELFV